MSKYIKPICECGQQLVRVCQPAFNIRIEPLKNGKIPDIKTKNVKLSQMIPDSFPDHLECDSCGKMYDYVRFKDGRIKEMWEV